jgi:hypothetical protein
MTTNATPLRAESVGNSSTTDHPYDWKIDAETELLVTKVTIATGAEEPLVLNTGYTVTGVGNPLGGNVVITPAISNAYRIVTTSQIPFDQPNDFTNQVSPTPENLESSYDRLCRQIKRIAEELDRCVKVTVGSEITPDELIQSLQTQVATATAAAATATGAASTASDAALEATTAAALLPLNNFTAVTDPTVNDDTADGYRAGSEWINTLTGDRFSCTSAALGAAIWTPISADLSALSNMAYETKTDYVLQTEVPAIKAVAQNSNSDDYTAVLSDAGKYLYHNSATPHTFTIPANASVAYPIGTALTFVNPNGSGTLTISITSDAMRLAGAGSTGSRTLAANGMATALKISATQWIIAGTGLT